MARKEEYRLANEAYMEQLAGEEGVHVLPGGILYKVIAEGNGLGKVSARSIVTTYYKGSLISGKVFDDAWERNCPEAFRVNELIEGFQIALMNMHIGDHWQVFIPWQKGYGKWAAGNIPAFSTLIFEIQLVGIV